MSIIVNYPRAETPWVRYCVSGEPKFLLTSKEDRSLYYLYEVMEDGKVNRLGKAKEPPELIEKHGVYRILNMAR